MSAALQRQTLPQNTSAETESVPAGDFVVKMYLPEQKKEWQRIVQTSCELLPVDTEVWRKLLRETV